MNNLTIVVIKGDGIGRTKNGILGVTDSAIKILDAAVEKAYAGTRKITWVEALAGDIARETNFPNLTNEEFNKLPCLLKNKEMFTCLKKLLT